MSKKQGGLIYPLTGKFIPDCDIEKGLEYDRHFLRRFIPGMMFWGLPVGESLTDSFRHG